MKRNIFNFFGSRLSAQSLKMISFCKSASCPASSELLAFQKSEMLKEEARKIGAHIKTCDFCQAEADFYARFPQAADEEMCTASKIPAPLYQLAEALLGSKEKNFLLLKTLFGENENLTLEKA